MSLAGGDLTTPARVGVWIPNLSSASASLVAQLISSMTGLIYSKLNRQRIFSQTFVRTIDGTGGYQILLPDWPVTGIISVQLGSQVLLPSPLPSPTGVASFNLGYEFR